MSKYVIMWDGGYGVEEIDEAETVKEANYLMGEYRLSYGGRIWKKRG